MTQLLLHFRVILACLLLWCAPAMAQDELKPIVEVEFSETEVIPGQPVVMRITVLVPTWLPKPIAFPSYEAPDLIVKLLERATTPASRSIEGETWSGVTRAYRLSPMVPGVVDIPAQTLEVQWAEPGQTAPNTSQITLDAASITGVVPDGAEDLEPFIAATSLSLSEDLSSEVRSLKLGDSLTRTITLKVTGTSPVFIPTLMPKHDLPGAALYPAEPKLTETADRTWVSGTRVESTTVVAESGGGGALPEIEVRWYNLSTAAVETARIEGVEIHIDGPASALPSDLNWRKLGLAVVSTIVLVLLGSVSFRWCLPVLRQWLFQRRLAKEATERWAFYQLEAAVRQRDLNSVFMALSVWRSRVWLDSQHDIAALEQALSNVGACRYGNAAQSTDTAWRALSSSISKVRNTALKKQQATNVLPNLNPV